MQKVLRLLGVVGIATVLALPGTSQACVLGQGNGGIFPENNANIPVGRFGLFSIEKEVFMSAIDRAEKIYGPVFVKEGRTLEIQRKWEDGTVNAYASREGTKSIVAMFGGLARHPLVTGDAFSMVICHELGHHIGGAPKKKGFFFASWASNEGQSDYFATLKCAREIWKNEDNEAIVANMIVDSTAKARCEKSWSRSDDVALCIRSAMAGKSLADTLADLGKAPTTDFSKPDTKVVVKTDDAHPAAQCRLDTYFAGSLCTVDKDIAVDDADATKGTCASENKAKEAFRPMCWYKPAGVTPQPTPTPTGRPTPRPTPSPTPGGSTWPR